MGIKVVGELVPCAGCFGAKGRKIAVLLTTDCRSTKPLQRLFMDLLGRMPPSPGCAEYLVMVVDDYSRSAWPYFLKKSDVSIGFGRVRIDIRAQGTPWSVCAGITAPSSRCRSS